MDSHLEEGEEKDMDAAARHRNLMRLLSTARARVTSVDKTAQREYRRDTSLSREIPSAYRFWSKRLRATPARRAVLDLLKASTKSLSAHDIWKKIESGSPATVYRALNELVAMGVVWKIYPFTRRRALFELKPRRRTR